MTQQHASGRRRTFLLATLASAGLPLLQGCFPLVAGGVGAGALMIVDRRTSGAYVEDEGIEWRAANHLRENLGDAVHINATSYNRVLLITGEAPDEATRVRIEQLAGRVDNVRSVVNEVQVAGNSSLSSRSNDALITSKVKARFIDDKSFNAHHVKVLTEAGTVFLMGLVTRREADAATEIARTTSGVRKVVRVFEYVSEEEAQRMDSRVGKKQ